MKMEQNMQQDNLPEGNAESMDDFFNALEGDVNGMVQDEQTREKPSEQVTQPTKVDSEEKGTSVDNWEKRYKDSSSEALQMRETLNKYEPFMPVIDAMREDPELIGVVKNYLEGNVQPADVKDKLGLDEDFVFDSDEAFSSPDSDSAKLMNAAMDKVVQKRLSEAQSKQQMHIQQALTQKKQAEAETAFKTKHNMSDEQFQDMVGKAKQHQMTLEDVHGMVYKDQINQNVANATRDDMIGQMKQVRNIPQSAGNMNNVGTPQNEGDAVFNAIKGLDSDLDNLFG